MSNLKEGAIILACVLGTIAVGLVGATAWQNRGELSALAKREVAVSREAAALEERVLQNIDVECRMYSRGQIPNREMESMCRNPAEFRGMARTFIAECLATKQRLAQLGQERQRAATLEALELATNVMACEHMGVPM